jgi:hypothetical protein
VKRAKLALFGLPTIVNVSVPLEPAVNCNDVAEDAPIAIAVPDEFSALSVSFFPEHPASTSVATTVASENVEPLKVEVGVKVIDESQATTAAVP